MSRNKPLLPAECFNGVHRDIFTVGRGMKCMCVLRVRNDYSSTAAFDGKVRSAYAPAGFLLFLCTGGWVKCRNGLPVSTNLLTNEC